VSSELRIKSLKNLRQIKTKNLKSRILTIKDSEFVIELLNSPGWLRFIGDRGVHTRADVKEYIAALKKISTDSDPALQVVILDGQPIGLMGFLKRPHLAMPDIGFAFLPDFIGKGYAYEMSKAYCAQGLTQFGKICAIASPDNIACHKLLHQLGFVDCGIYFDQVYQEELSMWELGS
jgi:RimJ/RimL family protein N-acetyltransferase